MARTQRSADPAWQALLAADWSAPIGHRRSGRWTDNLNAGMVVGFHAEGIEVLRRRIRIVNRWAWADISGLALEDASRLTATRMATLGLAGAGLKKRGVLLTFTGPDVFGDRRQVVLTIHHTTHAELAGQLQVVAAQVPELAHLLEPAPATGGDSLADQLEQLAALHRAGALTDEEFTRAKDRMLEQGG